MGLFPYFELGKVCISSQLFRSCVYQTSGSLALPPEGFCFRSATVLKLPPKVLVLVDRIASV